MVYGYALLCSLVPASAVTAVVYPVIAGLKRKDALPSGALGAAGLIIGAASVVVMIAIRMKAILVDPSLSWPLISMSVGAAICCLFAAWDWGGYAIPLPFFLGYATMYGQFEANVPKGEDGVGAALGNFLLPLVGLYVLVIAGGCLALGLIGRSRTRKARASSETRKS